MDSENKRCCNTCRFGLLSRCETLSKNELFLMLESASNERFLFKEQYVCDGYKSRYIEYPIEVSAINIDTEIHTLGADRIGSFVRIRPCGDNNTYLGLLLGDLPVGIRVTHNPETKVLSLSYQSNPAIFVFDLKKIVYGQESWWGVVESAEDLRDITDSTIDNQWYVRALKHFNGVTGEENKESETL